MRRCSVNGRVSDTQPDNVLTVRISPDYPDVSEVARERYRGIHATPSAHGIPATVAITLERTTSMSATYIYNSPVFGIVANSATKRPERPSASWHAEHYAAGPFERTKGIKNAFGTSLSVHRIHPQLLTSTSKAWYRSYLPRGATSLSQKTENRAARYETDPSESAVTRPCSIAQRSCYRAAISSAIIRQRSSAWGITPHASKKP